MAANIDIIPGLPTHPPLRVLFLRLLLVFAIGPAALAHADGPLVAIPGAILQKHMHGGDLPEKEAAPLAELVQLALQSDLAFADTRFVERAQIDAILREHALSLESATADARDSTALASVRAGRLLRADWILRLRLRADDLARLRVEAEVIDSLRADLLARVDTPVSEPPNESWLLQPTDAAVRLATDLAARALRAAETRQASLNGLPRVAPLAFVDRSPHQRLAPLAPFIQSALRRPRPGLHVLAYEAEGEARAESALFLAGLVDLDPAVWSRVADAYVWGEFTEDGDYTGPITDLPVHVRLHVWSDDRGPREITVSGRFGDLPALADIAADTALAALGDTRIADSPGQRAAIAHVLRESARDVLPKSSDEAARLASLALFFEPIDNNTRSVASDILASFSGMRAHAPAALALRRALGPDQRTAATRASPPPAPTARPASPLDPYIRAGSQTKPDAALDSWRARPREELLAAAESGPIITSPWLAPDWKELPRERRVPAESLGPRSADEQATPLALAHGALWLSPRPSWWNNQERLRPGLWRLDLASIDTTPREIAGFPGSPVSALAIAPDGHLWTATRGRGLLHFDSAAPEHPSRIGVAEGLPRTELAHLFRGPDAWFVGPWSELEGVVTAVSFDGARVSQIAAPPLSVSPGLPAAARAAIVAFGDDAPPRVRLPTVAAFAYEERPVAPPALPAAFAARLQGRAGAFPPRTTPDGRDGRHANLACPTGLGDGYWIASLDSVAWASGSRLVPLAHWLQGEIAAITDDGRHLIVAVSRRQSLHDLRALPPDVPDTFALHFYDYREGLWRGRLSTPHFFQLLAGDGRLLLVSFNPRGPWLIADSAGLRPGDPPVPPSPEALARARTERSPGRILPSNTIDTAPRKAASPRDAVDRRDATLLRQILADSSREDINRSAHDGRTALFAAADAGWAEGVRLLLEAGADNFSRDPITKRTLRDVAAPWPEVSVLINRRPGAADNQIEGARAVAAILKGDPSGAVEVPLTPAVLRYRDFWSWTVLHHALRQRRTDLSLRLIAAGAPLDTLTDHGESPLCFAAFHADEATLVALLRAGADVNLRSGRGWLPLHAAASRGRADLVRLLLAARADPRPVVGDDVSPVLVLAAATPEDEESLRLLVEAGAPLDATDGEGFGPLEAAVISDSPAKIQYLLDRGARWRKPVGPAYHPMDAAAKRGLTASIRKLQALGLQSPRALSLAKDDATRALLQADDSAAGRLRRLNEEQWPVVLADPDPARRRERMLAHLDAGADPDHLSAAWGTPLDLAVFLEDPDLVKELIARGADPAKKSKGMAGGSFSRPRTALHAFLAARVSYGAEPAPPPPGLDDLVLAYLPLFWPHETSPELRGEMLHRANHAGLARSAAWMRENLKARAP